MIVAQTSNIFTLYQIFDNLISRSLAIEYTHSMAAISSAATSFRKDTAIQNCWTRSTFWVCSKVITVNYSFQERNTNKLRIPEPWILYWKGKIHTLERDTTFNELWDWELAESGSKSDNDLIENLFFLIFFYTYPHQISSNF